MATGMAEGVIACTLESHITVHDYRSFPWKPNCHVTFFPFSVFNNTLAHGARAVDAIKTFEEVVVLGNQSLETSRQVNRSLQEIMNRVSNLIVTSWSSALYDISGQSFKTNKLLSDAFFLLFFLFFTFDLKSHSGKQVAKQGTVKLFYLRCRVITIPMI